MSERETDQPEAYEPPLVESLPAEDGPAVTAAGESFGQDTDEGAEWRPRDRGKADDVSERDADQPGAYEPPLVESLPAEDGPAVTAAGHTGGDAGDQGPEWRPAPGSDEHQG